MKEIVDCWSLVFRIKPILHQLPELGSLGKEFRKRGEIPIRDSQLSKNCYARVCVCVCVWVYDIFLEEDPTAFLNCQGKEDHKGSHCIIQLPHFSFIVVVFLILKRMCFKTFVVRSSVNIKKSKISVKQPFWNAKWLTFQALLLVRKFR